MDGLYCIWGGPITSIQHILTRIMFNTAFIRSNVLMLNSDDVDILWGSKERYPKNFRAEVNLMHIVFETVLYLITSQVLICRCYFVILGSYLLQELQQQL
jgi:hypothetical protein